ncbi:GerAB/ArcD/ProY family transporter [Paenibacillus thalictri]|uniref:Spore gernimation protein n=1 Tax=Paenibacillus thalictri TaxID=2527873 RepID=A0A4Q9DZ07_9BACL|nr:endospore germination permease [Paenibacillus thalictri]TBL81148.1 spore gernimation protein [Paenibacillus thalictri]
MLDNGKISPRQFSVFVTLFIVGGSILYVPSGLAHAVKQDAWISSIMEVVGGLALVVLYSALGSRFPNMTLAEYSEKLLGKWLGKGISLLYFMYFMFNTASFVRQIGDFLTTQIFPDTPIMALHIVLFLLVVMGVRVGLEAFARASEIFFPWVVALFLILLVSISPQIQIQLIQPVFEEGVRPVAAAAVNSLGNPFLQLVLLLMLFPYVNRTKEARKSFLLGTMIGGLALILVTLLSILVLGSEITEINQFISYSLVKKINVGAFFQRIEAIMAIIWFISMYVKITICFYASTLSLAQTLQVRHYRALTYPLGMIILVLSLIVNENIVESNLQAEDWTSFSLPFGLIFPLLLLAASRFKKSE